MTIAIILIMVGVGCLIYLVWSFSTGEGGGLIAFGGMVFCLIFGISGIGRALQPPLPPVPASGQLTQAESEAYTGPVTPGVFLRFLNWSGPLTLGTVASSTGSQITQSGTSSGSASGGFLFLGIGGLGVGRTSSTSASTTQTLPYREYEFSVVNQAGQAVVLTFPATSLEFTQIRAGQKPSVRFVFNNTVFYVKGADRTSIFAAGEDPDASGSGPYGGDLGQVFANTSIGVLLAQWVVDVQAFVTPGQFAQLTNPQLTGVPAS